MKISKYTFFFNIDGKEYYTYNTLSNSLLEIDEESYSIFQNHKTGIQELSSEKVDKELWDVLCENNILTDSDEDDYLKYKAIIMRQRSQRASNAFNTCPDYGLLFPLPLLFREIQGEKVHDTGSNGSNYQIRYVMS